jgi:ribonuclease P protein component
MLFPKSEKLCSKILIQKLFENGKNEFAFPFKFLYLIKDEPTNTPPQILIIVSKKTFKKATDRNRIKRQIREAYRLQKHKFLDENKKFSILCAVFVFVGKTKLKYQEIQKGIHILSKKIK